MTTVEARPPQTATPAAPVDRAHRRGRGLFFGLGRTLVVRILELAGFLVLLVTALFFLVRVQSDPAAVLAGPDATQDQLEAVRHLYGFDRPLIVQYWSFLQRFLTFDFGNSVQEQRPALDVVLQPAVTTLMLCAFATLLNVLISTPLGIYLGGTSGHRGVRRTWSGVVVAAQGIQFYIVGMLLVLLLAVRTTVFPATGWDTPSSWVLPTVSLAWLAAPRLTRVVSSSAEQVWASDMVTGAHAFGLRHRTIQYRYVLPNVLVPLISTAGTQFTLMLSGAVIIEGLFGISGLGQLLVLAVQNGDFPVLAASVTVIGVVVFAVTTLSDVAYQLVDPRLRRSST